MDKIAALQTVETYKNQVNFDSNYWIWRTIFKMSEEEKNPET